MINLGIADKIKAYGAIAVAIVLGALLIVQTARVYTRAVQITGLNLTISRLETTLANERLASIQELANVMADYRKKEQGLTERVDQIKKDKDEQVTTIAAQRDALLKRVRDAEARAKTLKLSLASTLTPNGATPYGGDGTELLGTLGEEDVLEAERADIIRVGLLACYKQYEDARRTLAQ